MFKYIIFPSEGISNKNGSCQLSWVWQAEHAFYSRTFNKIQNQNHSECSKEHTQPSQILNIFFVQIKAGTFLLLLTSVYYEENAVAGLKSVKYKCNASLEGYPR